MKLSFKQELSVEHNIDTPAFYSHGDSYIGIIDEGNIITLYFSKNLTQVSAGPIEVMKYHLPSIADFSIITESEFFNKHNEILESLSFKPKLIEK